MDWTRDIYVKHIYKLGATTRSGIRRVLVQTHADEKKWIYYRSHPKSAECIWVGPTAKESNLYPGPLKLIDMLPDGYIYYEEKDTRYKTLFKRRYANTSERVGRFKYDHQLKDTAWTIQYRENRRIT